MRRTRAAVAVLAAAIALPAAGCGKDKPKIPQSDARDLVILLKAVQRQDKKKSCNSVSRTIAALQSRVETLPVNTDPDIRATLRDGVTNLRNLVATDCATVKPKPKETTTTETQTEPSTTSTQPSTTTTTPSTQTTPSTKTTPSTRSTPSTPSTPSNPSGGAPSGKAAKKALKGKTK